MENLFEIAQMIIGDNLSVKEVEKLGYNRKEIEIIVSLQNLLNENGWKCNADGRSYVAERITEQLTPREFDRKKWLPVLEYAEKVGGCLPGEKYDYPNAQGGISTAQVVELYHLPKDMVNPYLVTFGGVMHAPLFGMEIIRFHAKQTGMLLPLLCIGKGGKKDCLKRYSTVITALSAARNTKLISTFMKKWLRQNMSVPIKKCSKIWIPREICWNSIALPGKTA